MDKYYLIVVWQPDCLQPSVYRWAGPRKPSAAKLVKLGVDYLKIRGDNINIDRVSWPVAYAVRNAIWLRE